MSESDDPFRFCIYCGADCYVDEPEHAETCPSMTGIIPVRKEDEMPCPHCGKGTRETCCMDCGASLEVGDHYALRDADTGLLAIRPHIGEVICLGCAAQAGLLAEGR